MSAGTGNQLVVLLSGRRAAVLNQDVAGRLELTYEDDYREARDATPVSLSMPLATRSHYDPVVRAFLWGLLPDNDGVLERWARDYQVSARNPFALLRHVGEDCAGAAQCVVADRAQTLLSGSGGVEWIDEAEIAARLRLLRTDPAAWHAAHGGQFSLAGAQAKTALLYDSQKDRWGDPYGAVPTTHILKPAITGFTDHDLNEHLCLETAHLLGLPAARSRIAEFGGERAVVVERYDRIWIDSRDVRRIHQEDMCQALGLPPTAKYQNEGGPTPEQIIHLLRQEIVPANAAAGSVQRFIDALAFNWLIGGTDAHAKNYSLLLAGHQVRLAPLYDLASALPYDDMYVPKLKMAMRIGGEYRLERIRARHWRRFAEQNSLDPEAVIIRIADLAERMPDSLAAATHSETIDVFDTSLSERLLERATTRARQCRKELLDHPS